MKNLQKLGGFAALYLAVAYLTGGGLTPAAGFSNPSSRPA